MTTQVSILSIQKIKRNQSTHSSVDVILPWDVSGRNHSHRLPSGTGGKKILQRVAGKDASKQFWKYHNEGILKKFKGQLQIGSLDSKKAEVKPATEPMPVAVPKKPTPVRKRAAGEDQEVLEPFGEQIPYSDPSWYQSVSVYESLQPNPPGTFPEEQG